MLLRSCLGIGLMIGMTNDHSHPIPTPILHRLRDRLYNGNVRTAETGVSLAGDEMTDEETNWENYETGPFCRHWGDPSDCDEICDNCGHACHKHSKWDDYDSPCNVDECGCQNFGDKP